MNYQRFIKSFQLFYNDHYETQKYISHNKFFILVSPTGDAHAVWTGSTNLTSGAIFGHSNVGHVLREPSLCDQYLKYWEKLKENPEKKDIAAFNEEHSPLPDCFEALHAKGSLALFSPRLRWARALDFFAQLINSAKNCVAFTAAFGISKDVAPALLGNGSLLKLWQPLAFALGLPRFYRMI